MHPAADDRRHGRRQRKHEHGAAHQPLRIGAFEQVAHHGARHGWTDAGGQPLQHPAEQQGAEGGREEATDGADGVEHQTADHDAATAQRIGQRPMHQREEREGQQVGGDDLLHLPAGQVEFGRDGGKRRQEGVDGQRPDHRQAGEQQRDAQCRRATARWRL